MPQDQILHQQYRRGQEDNLLAQDGLEICQVEAVKC